MQPAVPSTVAGAWKATGPSPQALDITSFLGRSRPGRNLSNTSAKTCARYARRWLIWIMAKPRFIFFDVGNTLLFPNRPRMLAPLPADRHPSLDVWQALERRTKHEFDAELMERKIDHGFWWTFHTYLLQGLNALDDPVRDTLVENTQNSAN